DVADSEARHLTSLGRLDEAQKLEREVYDVAEKVLVQRPSDMRSLSNRFFAANLLGTLAERRYDDATAADYAKRAAQAGEDYVRFNPADLTTWSWWVTGLEQVAQLQFERGDVTGALAADCSGTGAARRQGGGRVGGERLGPRSQRVGGAVRAGGSAARAVRAVGARPARPRRAARRRLADGTDRRHRDARPYGQGQCSGDRHECESNQEQHDASPARDRRAGLDSARKACPGGNTGSPPGHGSER